MKTKIPWSKPSIGEPEKRAVQQVMDSGWVTMGAKTREFEAKLASVTDRKYNVFVNNGTSALIAALMARDSDTVHLPAYTFPATLNAVYGAGYTNVVYHDVDRDTVLMNPPEVASKDHVYMPVSYAGLPLNPGEWNGVPNVVEDAAESLGAAVVDTVHGGGHWTRCYSLHAAKIMTTIEGGVIATDDPDEAHLLQAIRCHGEDPNEKGSFITRGLNLKPTDINAAIGLTQLERLPQFIWNRNRIAELYKEELGSTVRYQQVPDYVKTHPYMMFPIMVDDPEMLRLYLKTQGIDTRLGWKPLSPRPGALELSRTVICLPIYNTMTEAEAMIVVDAVKERLR